MVDFRKKQQNLQIHLQSQKASKSRRILLSTLARMVIVRGDALEIRYNYANECPALQNPVKAECSYNHRLVEMRGVEPLSKKPVP